MKKLIFILLLLSGCDQLKKNQQQQDENIKMRERAWDRIQSGVYYKYDIVQVDGHEYLSSNDGGIIHLVSCKKESEK